MLNLFPTLSVLWYPTGCDPPLVSINKWRRLTAPRRRPYAESCVAHGLSQQFFLRAPPSFLYCLFLFLFLFVPVIDG